MGKGPDPECDKDDGNGLVNVRDEETSCGNGVVNAENGEPGPAENSSSAFVGISKATAKRNVIVAAELERSILPGIEAAKNAEEAGFFVSQAAAIAKANMLADPSEQTAAACRRFCSEALSAALNSGKLDLASGGDVTRRIGINLAQTFRSSWLEGSGSTNLEDTVSSLRSAGILDPDQSLEEQLGASGAELAESHAIHVGIAKIANQINAEINKRNYNLVDDQADPRYDQQGNGRRDPNYRTTRFNQGYFTEKINQGYRHGLLSAISRKCAEDPQLFARRIFGRELEENDLNAFKYSMLPIALQTDDDRGEFNQNHLCAIRRQSPNGIRGGFNNIWIDVIGEKVGDKVIARNHDYTARLVATDMVRYAPEYS